MAKRPEGKSSADPMIPLPAESSREKIRGACDDAARILRDRGPANRAGMPTNRLLADTFAAEGVDENHDRPSPPKPVDHFAGWELRPARLDELIRACQADSEVVDLEPDSPSPLDSLTRRRGRKPPASVAALARGLIEEIPGLARSPDEVRKIIQFRLADGMTGDAIADAIGINAKLLRIDSFVDDALETLEIELSKYYNLFDTVAYYFDLIGQHPTGFYRLPLPDDTPLPKSGGPDERRSENLAALLSTIPADVKPAERLRGLDDLNREYRRAIMPRLRDALNDRIQEMPHATLDQKERIADWVNGELASYGLAVKCPKTGLPGSLSADVGNWPGVGRFQIRSVSPDGKRHRTSSDTMPRLELVELSPAVEAISPATPAEPESSWEIKVGPKADRPGRVLSD